jgi:hypothetical protein
MKKIRIFLGMLLLAVVTSCATSALAQRRITEMDEEAIILKERYPQLFNYYMEGVLKVNSLREYVNENGDVDYNLKYSFVRYYYRNHYDMLDALKTYLPDLHYMYVNGIIEVTSLYKYVDRETGQIRHRARYRNIYDYYYDYYPRYNGVHIYYHPRINRPVPPPRHRPTPPRVEPNRPHNPGGNRPPQQHNGNHGRGGRR